MNEKVKKNLWFFIAITGVFFYYMGGIFFPDGNILRHRNDELHFHVPTIKKIAESHIPDSLKDYPAATFPLFHILASPLYKSLPDHIWIIRNINLLLTLITAFLIYYYFFSRIKIEDAHNRSVMALSISLTFLLSPYVRASALSVSTDNLPYLFIISGLITIDLFDRHRKFIFIPLAIMSGFAAFYTRQYYIWVPILFISEFIKLRDVSAGLKFLYSILSILLAIPAVFLFLLWGGAVPPGSRIHHEASGIWMMLPFVFSFIPVYLIPVYILWFRKFKSKKLNWKNISLISITAFFFCFIYLQNTFNLRLADGSGVSGLILSAISYKYAPVMFLILSYLGLVSIIYLIFKYPIRNYIWALALGPFLFTRVFWQKYFDPMIVFLIFITLPPRWGEKLAETKLILLFPIAEISLFIAVSFLFSTGRGLP